MIVGVFGAQASEAKPIDTNAALFNNPPKWLKRNRAEKVIGRIQTKLEWTIRKINITFYTDQKAFEKVHGYGSVVRAVTLLQDQSVHLGPRVNNENFDGVLGHELVHVIFKQKYSGAIPKWLEEGLANHIAGKGKPQYQYVASRPFPKDVRDLVHPLKGTNEDIHYAYAASRVLIDMVAKKCDLENLLRLSVERKMENYIATYCEIKDLNQAFQDWVNKKTKNTNGIKKSKKN